MISGNNCFAVHRVELNLNKRFIKNFEIMSIRRVYGARGTGIETATLAAVGFESLRS